MKDPNRSVNVRPLVIYHGNCADGFGAAWVFHHHFGAGVCDFHVGVYGEAPPDVTGRVVFLVDFSYKRAVVEQMIQDAEQVTLIDHHVTAIDDLKDLPGLLQYTDIGRSGARLAWDYLHQDYAGTPEPPRLLLHIEDRDLWRFKLPNTREIQANVFSHPYSFELWDKLMSAGPIELLEMTVAGAAIERKHFKDIKELLAKCKRNIVINGELIPAASLPYTMSSDAAGIMAEDAPYAVCYYDTPTERCFSLRSRKDGGADVSEVAKSFGGGGHKNAAGFAVPRDHILARM